MSAAGVLLSAVLRLAPREFRDRHGAELLATHRERMSDASGRGRVAAFDAAVRELAGGLWLVIQLRAGELLGRRPAGAARPPREGMLSGVSQDVRFALRTLRRSPSYAVTGVIVLALGIGASTAIFSAMNAFFFRPLPFADADRLAMLYETNPEFGWVDAAAAPANVLDWREQVDAFEDIAAYSDFIDHKSYIDDGEPVLLGAATVTGNFFSVLGARAALGRTFRWEDTWEAAEPGVVLSHDVWVTQFGADAGVIDRSIELDGQGTRIIGVMPEGFAFPGAGTDMWASWGWAPANRDAVWFRRAHFVRPIGRLAAGVTHEEADAQLQVVVRRLQSDFPATNSVMGAGTMPLRDFLIRDVKRPLMILFGAVGLLLLLACVNVANLTLVRGTARTREMALRHALGAGRVRLTRQLLTESLLLSGAGGVAGIALGWVAVRAMSALTQLGIDGATGIALDGRVLLFTVAVTLASAVLFGLAPAVRSSRGRVYGAIVDGGTGAGSGRGSMNTMGGLVTAEVALALLLVMAAGLMTRSFMLMRQVDPGFRTEGVLAVELSIPSARYADRDAVLAFQDRLLESLEARAGIERAGIVAQLPLGGTSWSSQFQAAGWPPDRVGIEILHRRADAGYFDALGIPLLRGRMFERRDGPDAPPVVVINETMAREHFSGEDPIGQRIAYDRVPDENSNWYEIIGIVADQHQVSPAVPARAEVFESRHQDWARTNWVVLRTSTDPASVIPAVRAVLRELDPLIPIVATRPLREVWRASMAREEFILTLLAAFGAVALVLAAVGVYAVTAQTARRRTRELGIRIALGARARDVITMMLRQSLALVALGLAVGLAVSLVASRALMSVLYQVKPTDGLTIVTVVLVLGGVGALACYLPTRRALASDPVRSLREE